MTVRQPNDHALGQSATHASQCSGGAHRQFLVVYLLTLPAAIHGDHVPAHDYLKACPRPSPSALVPPDPLADDLASPFPFSFPILFLFLLLLLHP
ncbi:hypothetical protein S40285_10103 [Stachybotrys chlorohalonatus IBT 40285]|uniref:Uncharacterized protein n=1 Tax=Stachybotrys chlorohalonatus (strain IBT 40285) TaxID=1283841 RepID=A0A084QC01_STAC4|nr:hypothetical protein S40285_10103 [Stachybotrys chlorohalonata IBT 40285]